ncbi:hypothetical protein GCM10010471_05500 [Leucobacter komagatae]
MSLSVPECDCLLDEPGSAGLVDADVLGELAHRKRFGGAGEYAQHAHQGGAPYGTATAVPSGSAVATALT